MSEKEPSVDELLGEEDLGLDPPALSEQPAERRRLPQRSLAIGVGLVVFVILWIISSAHHDNFYLSNDDGTVRVERGWYFPFGSSEWSPNRAYTPFRLPDDVALDDSGALTAAELDETLMALFRRVAKREIKDVAGGNSDLAEDMLLRANKLMHTTIDDERELMNMLGDVHFHQGLRTLRDVQRSFDLAYRQFNLAAQRGGVEYTDADKWARTIKEFQHKFQQLSKEAKLDVDQFFTNPPQGINDALKQALSRTPGSVESTAPASK